MKKTLVAALIVASPFLLDAHAQTWESTFIEAAEKGKVFTGEALETGGMEQAIDVASIRPYKNQSGKIVFWVKTIEADESTRTSLRNFYSSLDTFSEEEKNLLREAARSGGDVSAKHPRAHLPNGTPLEVSTTLYAAHCSEMSMALMSGTSATATHRYDYAAMVRLLGMGPAYEAYKDDARKARIFEALDNYTVVHTLNVPSTEVEFQYVQPGTDGESWLKRACSIWKRKNKPEK
jgi:hypothetical protein